MAWVEVPVDEDNVPEFSLFEGDEEVTTGPRAWRASELLNDYVSLQDSPRYGIVDDIVIDRQGRVQAVVVYPDVTYGVAGGMPIHTTATPTTRRSIRAPRATTCPTR
jgi:hypothetical protein